MKEGNKVRCDHCGEWRKAGDLVTLPESLYPMLDYDNEFGICWDKCAQNYDLEYWKEWVSKRKSK